MTQVTARGSAAAGGVGIAVRGVRRAFEGHRGPVSVLEGLSLEVEAGDFVAILGPSGCGKSTLLRLIAGLDRPDGGQVELRGAEGTNATSGGGGGIAYVFQDAHLLPWRDVLGNVVLPLELMGQSRRSRKTAALAAIEKVGLSEAVDRYPAQLSGGMRMRVSLARALVTRPRLLLLDEPFAALDEITRQHLDEELRALWRESRMTVVFVTHSTSEAVYLAERAVVLSKRPARIVRDVLLRLPGDRPKELRGTAEFARETAGVYAALEEGELMP
ncbi:MAG: ABC transporter ATP-binding protein [Phycisphaeraceae bacterium]|nr:ABC transporter ATP-binding protein [Phycisphaeraceae bacterium]